MFLRKKTAALSLAAIGSLAWTSVGVAGSASAATYTCGSVSSATWGSGQVCKGNDGSWKLRVRDEATDGYCVEGYYYSEDRMAYRQTNPRSQECNGVWKTVIITSHYLDSGARIYSNGRYKTLDQP